MVILHVKPETVHHPEFDDGFVLYCCWQLYCCAFFCQTPLHLEGRSNDGKETLVLGG